jgi:hypothetical protein
VVKIRRHILKQHNKNKKNQKPYEYDQFSLDFPMRFRDKIRPYSTKNFELLITFDDTPRQEAVNISLVRKKTAEEIGNHKLF